MDIDLIKLLQPELIILIAVIYLLGMFVKKIPNFPDWLIPLFLLLIGIVLTIVYKGIVLDEGMTAVTYINGLIYGVIVAGIAVFTNQTIKQVTINKKTDKEP